MKTEVTTKAVIYCRVSDKKQRIQGSGLDSQEHRCREYASMRGYEVDMVFLDDVTAGGDFMNRPGMVKLLRFLDKSRASYIVIFDDLKRFARDTEFHLGLRKRLATYGASVECLNFKFEDTPEGKFVETIVAAQGELERHQNRRQTLQKMKARLERGYWPFQVPMGYRFVKSEGGGKVLIRQEPLASLLQEALEGYAQGRFQSQAEVQRFLEAQPEYPKSGAKQKVNNLLRRVLYSGHVEHAPWGVSLRKGHHEALISYETYQRIQDRLSGHTRSPARKDMSADFPLKGFVVCGDCGGHLTACWTKGRNDYHPYYLCYQKGCESYGKSIRKDAIEGEFELLLTRLRPSEELFNTACMMFEDLWNHQAATHETQAQSLRAELAKIKHQTEQLLVRILDATLPSVINAYEKRIAELHEQEVLAAEKIARCGRPAHSLR
jgi:site-specific DNA recombinase